MQIYKVYQSGKRLYIDEKENPDNKIAVNKFESEQTTLRLISDGTLPPRLYWALRNPKLSNKYFILKLVNNEDLIVGTDISATPGLWDMLLIGTPDDYIIEGADIDQSKLTYVSDHFGRLFVRDNFLEELDFEEQTSPTFRVFYDEIIFQLGNKADKKDIPDKMSDLENDTNFISGVVLKDDGEGNVEIVGTTFSGGETEEGEIPSGGNVEVDDKLDEESTNPVQNQVITKEVKSLKEKDESLDKEVIALRERNAELEQTVEKLQIKTTTSPSPFHHITDSANMKVVDFGMEGKTEQETTEGRNWISEKFSDYESGLYSATDGTKTDNVNAVRLKELIPVSNSIIYNYVESPVEGVAFLVRGYGENKEFLYNLGKLASGSTKFIQNDTKYLSISLINDDITMTLSDWKETFENGLKLYICSNTDNSTYEPYTGAQPSPNPDYPQEIVNAGVYNEETGRYEIGCGVGNKNWLSMDMLIDGVVLDAMGNSSYKDGYCATEPIRLPIGNWAFSCENTDNNVVLVTYNSSGKRIAAPINGKISQKTFTISDDTAYVRFGVHKSKEVAESMNIQLEYNGSPTEYTPHASQQFTLTSPVPLTKWDKLVKRDGVWGWSVNSVKMIADGNGEWIYNEGLKCFYLSCLPESMLNREGFCNQYVVKTSFVSTDYNFVRLGNNNKNVMVCKNSFIDSTLEDKALANWKVHLNEHPLEIWTYSDTEQVFHPLPDEEQTLLNNLETYYGVTNVYNEQGCPMWLTYVNDPELHWNQKLEQINNALLSLGANV